MKVSDRALVGTMFNYSENKADYGGAGFELTVPMGTLYAACTDGPWYVGASLGGGREDRRDTPVRARHVGVRGSGRRPQGGDAIAETEREQQFGEARHDARDPRRCAGTRLRDTAPIGADAHRGCRDLRGARANAAS
jgi:hypothetical protein